MSISSPKVRKISPRNARGGAPRHMRSRQRNEGDLSPFDARDVREKIHLGVPAKEKSVRGVVKEIWAALSRSIIEIPTPCRTDMIPQERWRGTDCSNPHSPALDRGRSPSRTHMRRCSSLGGTVCAPAPADREPQCSACCVRVAVKDVRALLFSVTDSTWRAWTR